MIKLCLLSANLISCSWCKGAGPQPVLSRWWLFVFVLRLQMGKGVALVGAGQKTSTLPPLFCSGKILNPRVFLMSTSFQDLFPKDLFSPGADQGGANPQLWGQAGCPTPSLGGWASADRRCCYLQEGMLAILAGGQQHTPCSDVLQNWNYLQSKLVSFYNVHVKITYFFT